MEFEFVEHNPGVDTAQAMRGYTQCADLCDEWIGSCSADPVNDAHIDTLRMNNLFWNQA